MLDEERRGDVSRMLEENRGVATGSIIATALAAALVAYMIRRARQEEEQRTPMGGAGRAWDRARDLVGDDRIEAGREFLTDKVLPEFKPVLLAVLKDLKDVSDDWFRQAEKSIKRM